MKIILINPPFLEVYGDYAPAAQIASIPQIPMGLCYIAASLENAGHNVSLIDASAEAININDLLTKILSVSPDIVGLTATTPIYPIAKDIIKKIKERAPNIITILGGFHITALPLETMTDCGSIDYGIVGEGESSIVSLLSALQENNELSNVPSLIFRDTTYKIIQNNPPPTSDINLLSFPARHLLNNDLYRFSVKGKGIVRVTSILTQRGCPFSCVFCGVGTMFTGKPRYRSAKNIVDEIEEVIHKFGISHFMFIDDTLTLNIKKVSEMCDELLNRKIHISFEGYTRANAVSISILKKLKETGLIRLSFGIETGDEKIMKEIKKGVDINDFQEAYQWCADLGIETRCSFMIGHPFETKQTIQKTIDLTKKIKCDQAYINIATPFPGSELYHMAERGYGGLKLLSKNWGEYKRYGTPVMELEGLKGPELEKYQRIAYLKFYLRPHIIYYNLKRAGFKAAILNSWAFFRSVLLPFLRFDKKRKNK